jgi:hypothetical protein
VNVVEESILDVLQPGYVITQSMDECNLILWLYVDVTCVEKY